MLKRLFDDMRTLARGRRQAVAVSRFRDIGFTDAAAQYPRDEMALEMFAAFNGAKPHQMPDGYRFFPNPSTRDAWNRVADAAYLFIKREADKKR